MVSSFVNNKVEIQNNENPINKKHILNFDNKGKVITFL